MKNFSYIAFDEKGVEYTGVRRAQSKLDLTTILLEDGLLLHKSQMRKSDRVKPSKTVEDLIARLELLLRADISVVDALELVKEAAPRECGSLALTLLERIRNGSRFSEAVASLPLVFDPLVCALIEVGENSGKLGPALCNAKLQLQWQREIRSRLRKLCLYPIIVSGVLFLVLTFLLIHVVPAFGDLLTGLGRSLPPQTQALLWLSAEYISLAWWIGTVLVSMLMVLMLLNSFHRTRLGLRRCSLCLPHIGNLSMQIRLARFSRAMAELMRASVNLLEAIEISKKVLECEYLEATLDSVHQQLLEGQTFSSAVLYSECLPRDYGRMLQLGESSGQLPEMLMQLSEIYEKASSTQLAALEAMAGPVLMTLLGGILMWIVLAVLGPIYDVLSVTDVF